MKFFRLDLLTLLISLFILNSCKNQGTVGLGLNSSAQLNGSRVDTSTVYTNTVLDDTVATTGLTKTPMGYFNDPIFGITQSDIATDLNLPSSYTTPTGTVIIDSARLVLQYADGFYGDSIASTYTANVYQLNERFNDGVMYYNDKKWNYNTNALLGSLTFKARPHDTVKIYNIISGAPDTLMKAPPQIRIPISSNFINTNLFNATGNTLASNTIFQNLVKGMYINIDKTKSTGAGGILMIKSDTLSVYYRTINGTTIDTLTTNLPISKMAAAITHTYSATIQTELNNTASSRGTVYLEGLSGLRAKVSFPSLLANLRSNLAKKDSDIILNRAELVLTPQPGSFIPYRPIPRLNMYRLDIAHQRQYVEDATATVDPRSGGPDVFGGVYNPTTNQYIFVITAYLQDLLLNRTTDYGTYIAPIDTSSVTSTAIPVNATPSVAARTVAGGANKTSPYQIRLNIIYTKIAK